MHISMKYAQFLLALIAGLFFWSSSSALAQKPLSLVERLGYPAGTKLLIIHADDLGVSHSENTASFKAMAEGSVRSASAMVPCPWFSEVVAYAKSHPSHDLGLHLTLTSEWKPYKWGPVTSRNLVQSLVDSTGYLYDNCSTFGARASPAEVERELRAQIEQAKKMGLEPTHFDSHMRCLFQNATLLAIYLKLGREYGVPVMVGQDFLNQADSSLRAVITDRDIVLNHVYTAQPADYAKGMQQYYLNIFRTLEAGVNELVIHTAADDAEMQGMTNTHGVCPAWCAAWRQNDLDFFTSDLCKKTLAEQNIRLITWREVGKLLKG